MPADHTLPSTSVHHGDASKPYQCSTRSNPPGAAWAINYGYCRTSLDWHGPDSKQGAGDPRCPATCQHKAPEWVAIGFGKWFALDGAASAATWAVEVRCREYISLCEARSESAKADLDLCSKHLAFFEAILETVAPHEKQVYADAMNADIGVDFEVRQ